MTRPFVVPLALRVQRVKLHPTSAVSCKLFFSRQRRSGQNKLERFSLSKPGFTCASFVGGNPGQGAQFLRVEINMGLMFLSHF